MKELVEYIVKSLVMDENSVKVTETEEENENVIHVFVAPDDMGRIIGKGVKIAQSIRSIVKAGTPREGKKTFVKFGE